MKIKRLIALCIACVMIAAMLPAGIGKGVYAAKPVNYKKSNLVYDMGVIVELDARFFVGYQVGDLIHTSPVEYTIIEKNPKNVIKTTERIVEKETQKDLSANDTLKDGVAYTYYIELESYNKDGSSDFHSLGAFGSRIRYYDESLKFEEVYNEKNDKKSVKIKAIDFYAFNIDKASSTDLGELTLDLRQGTINIDSENMDPVCNVMDYVWDYAVIKCIDYDSEAGIHYFDLNNDGIADITYDGFGLYRKDTAVIRKTDNCSVKESRITISMPEEGKKRLNTSNAPYYSTVTFIFSDDKPKTQSGDKKDNSSAKKNGETATKKNEYKNEWVNGQWYDANGGTSYTAKGQWKNDESGWWFEDELGWYPNNQWLRIDGKWYFFTESGYMDYSEYRDGCWLNADGSWDENYSNGTWHYDGTGWWFEDAGWYPQNQYLWINGVNYWFDADGYCK